MSGLRENILIIDDEPALRLGLSETLRAERYDAEEVDSCAATRERLRGPAPSLVLLDLQLTDGSGVELLPGLRQAWPDAPVVMMTAHASVDAAVLAMQRGAYTFLQKPLNTDELLVVLRQALEASRLRRQIEDRRRRKSEQFGFERIVARSGAMKKVLAQSRTVARSPASTVLLLGESGTGKGLIARAIHYASDRASNPFLTVTCSAIPEPLLEAELLGHEKGAFTDAKARRRGVFEAADGGTVFLDEIGDMPLSLQAKLLGVLEDRTFTRIGSTDSIHVDVRIIAATHRDLDRHVAEGRFREDLLYRLRVVPIVIPPLRERMADIGPLAETFIRRFNTEFGRNVGKLAPEAEEMLKTHPWPGSVRELRNVIERAMLFAESEELRAGDLLLDAGYRPRAPSVPAASAKGGNPFVLPPDGLRLDDLENQLVRQAMERAGGNKSRAAKILGISRDQIRYRLEKMEQERSSSS
ncbi:MAG: sigma-54-dependent transcriptional regulator [Planctomycetota bacterium]|jgi:DNA-binding NtrC family response regulator